MGIFMMKRLTSIAASVLTLAACGAQPVAQASAGEKASDFAAEPNAQNPSSASNARRQMLSATPENLMAVINRAPGGSTIKLARGSYGIFTLEQKTFDPALTLDATDATFNELIVKNVSGLSIRGGKIIGSPGWGTRYGITARWVKDLEIRDFAISGTVRGIVVSDAKDIALIDNRLTDLRSDGINFAVVDNILVQGNSCSDFTPIKATYDASGKRLKDGDHPDCIQSWASDGSSSNIRIIGNRMEGFMQGIFIAPASAGRAKGNGFSNVVVRDNFIRIQGYTGVRLQAVTGGEIIGNDVAAIPLDDGRQVKANISFQLSTGITMCGNKVPDIKNHPATARC
ncbi:MAG: right-handed parallel beta-helix repeat-containing protein [Parasphingorhabdus sp.]|nr:right-handed parallel beta-helix repeat-containing protein [Parasphingorhabdus sp.]